jgi:hypothetical protein
MQISRENPSSNVIQRSSPQILLQLDKTLSAMALLLGNGLATERRVLGVFNS